MLIVQPGRRGKQGQPFHPFLSSQALVAGWHSPVALGGTSRLTLTKNLMLSPETMEEFTASKSSSPPASSLASQPSSVSHLRYPANKKDMKLAMLCAVTEPWGHAYALIITTKGQSQAAVEAPGPHERLLWAFNWQLPQGSKNRLPQGSVGDAEACVQNGRSTIQPGT